jgi:cytochrome P450
VTPRRVVSRAARAAIRRFEAGLPALAAEHAARARAGGAGELVGEVATPFALAGACRLLDLPEADGPRLKRLSESFFHLFAPIRDAERLAQAEAGLAEFRAYFEAAIDAAPRDGLIADLRAPDADGGRLSRLQAADSLILLFADAVENVPYAAATALMALSAQDAGLARAAAEPGYARGATEEALRRDPPAQSVPRIARRDTEIAGQAVKADSPVFLSLGAANRDPEVFAQPARFDPDRDRSRALTFGAGRHSCLGAGLAAAQVSALVAALSAQGAATPARPETTDYAPRFGHRWPQRAALRWTEPRRG